MAIVETEDWLLKLPPGAATTRLLGAMEAAGMSAVRGADGALGADVKGSMLRNRWKSRVEITVEPAGAGTRAHCRVEMAGDKHLDVMDEIVAGLDADLLDDRGTAAAATRAGGLERRELRGLRSQIGADETVVAVGKGMHERQGAVVALTDRRLLIVTRPRRAAAAEQLARATVASSAVEELARATVDSIAAERGSDGDRLLIRAGERRIEVERMRPGQADALARAFGGPGGGPAAEALPDSRDPIDQLRRLGELRDAGVVTQEEFEAKKASLLDRI